MNMTDLKLEELGVYSEKERQEFARIRGLVEGIRPLNQAAMAAAKRRTDSLMKPLGSLGFLETLGIQLAGITGKVRNSFDRRCTIVMAADNGICKEGVASAPQEITRIQTENIAAGRTGISALSKVNGSDVYVVDIGVDGECNGPDIVYRKVRNGTDSFLDGSAMEWKEALAAIHVGIEAVETLHRQGYTLLGTGEMGIGNTSTATAVICALTGAQASEITGRGAGLTDEAYQRKVRVIAEGLRINDIVCKGKNDSRPKSADDGSILVGDGSILADDDLDALVIGVLSKVGGLDICGLTGCFIAAAYYRIPIVVDGVISIAAALAAYRMNPLVKGYLIPSHVSVEPGYESAVKEIGLHPCLNLNLRLGEGSGCPLMFGIIQGALACMNDIASFEEMNVSGDFLVDNRKD